MANELRGKKILFITSNEGVEQVELTEPWKAVEEAGGTPVLAAPEPGKVQGMNHLDKADSFEATVSTEQLRPDDYAGVVLPGGVANPDQLRTDKAAVKFLKQWVEAGRPVAAICHGPWTLVEAGVLAGKTITSWPSLQTDIRNAGGEWVDETVHNDGQLVTSRKPDDLPAFNRELIKVFAAA